jgi:uncharacterized membrane protein YfcA
VAVHGRHGSVRELVYLLPGVVPGLLLGTWFISRIDNTWMTLTR